MSAHPHTSADIAAHATQLQNSRRVVVLVIMMSSSIPKREARGNPRAHLFACLPKASGDRAAGLLDLPALRASCGADPNRPQSTLLDPNRHYSTLPRLFAIAPPKAGAALLPRTERARRPPEAENRAHIPRAIASREAMLWQGCSLSPRELERKAPRSVWATQLPASRSTLWIVRESCEANRTDFARFPTDGFRPH